jgi:hypothetical protein
VRLRDQQLLFQPVKLLRELLLHIMQARLGVTPGQGSSTCADKPWPCVWGRVEIIGECRGINEGGTAYHLSL